MQPRVFVILQYPVAEFLRPLNFLYSFADCLQSNLLLSNPGYFDPHLVVLFQSWPGQFNQVFINKLNADLPLVPILLVLGAATQGEARTGQPLMGTWRLYAHEFDHQFYQRQLRLFFCRQSSFLTLPQTASEEEISLRQAELSSSNLRKHPKPLSYSGFHPFTKNKADFRQCLIIDHFGPFGNDTDFNQLLADYARTEGDQVYYFSQNKHDSSCHVIFADADDTPFSKILKASQRLRHDFADAKIKVYVNSPRINDKNDLLNAGIDEIYSKPVFWHG